MKVTELKNDYDANSFLETHISVPTHLPVWSEILADYDAKLESFYLIAVDDGNVVGMLPGFFIDTDYGKIYHSIPYPGGYGGIVANSPEVYRSLLTRLINSAKERGCALLSIANQPWVEDSALYLRYFEPDYTLRNFLSYMDLRGGVQLDKKHEWDVSKAQKSGITFSDIATDECLGSFYEIFEGLMKHYESPHFDCTFFEMVNVRMVKQNKAKFMFALKDGKVVSGYLLLLHGQVMEYFHTAIHPDFKSLQPNSFLIYEGMKWGAQNGYRFWNWQSTRSGKESSVYKFKVRWGSREGFHYYFTKILGDCSKLFSATVSEIQQQYPFYYFLPFGALKNQDQQEFEKYMGGTDE